MLKRSPIVLIFSLIFLLQTTMLSANQNVNFDISNSDLILVSPYEESKLEITPATTFHQYFTWKNNTVNNQNVYMMFDGSDDKLLDAIEVVIKYNDDIVIQSKASEINKIIDLGLYKPNEGDLLELELYFDESSNNVYTQQKGEINIKIKTSEEVIQTGVDFNMFIPIILGIDVVLLICLKRWEGVKV